METLYDMVTKNAAQCIGIKDHEIKDGAPANFVILDQPNVLEALRFHERPVYVISHGKLVDQSAMDKIYAENK
jgi:cytosine deaminase